MPYMPKLQPCVVLQCRKKGVHPFPTNEVMRYQWIKATRVDLVKEYSAICSDHFTSSDYVARGKQLGLRARAVPSIFPWTETPLELCVCFKKRGKLCTRIHDLKLNPAKVTKTYSRKNRPFAFVQEYPTVSTGIEGEIDPLEVIYQNDDDSKHNIIQIKSENLSLDDYDSNADVMAHDQTWEVPVKTEPLLNVEVDVKEEHWGE